MSTLRRYFDERYRERARLDDNSEVVLRLLQPRDKTLLKNAFDSLSEESRYRRFFTHKQELTDAELAYLTELDGYQHLAIGAKTPGRRGEGLGVARFVRLDPPNVAEAAVAVIDRMQGRGLGRLLFQRLCAAAQERGIERLRCELLALNAPMRALLDSVAEDVTVTTMEDGVVTVEFPLPQVTPDQTAASAPRGNPLYQILVLAAQGMVAMRKLLDDWMKAAKRIGS